jgi:hypothetical protein
MKEFTDLDKQIDIGLASNLTNLIKLKDSIPQQDLNDVFDSRTRTRMLADALNELEKDLALLTEMKETTVERARRIEHINGDINTHVGMMTSWIFDSKGFDSIQFANESITKQHDEPKSELDSLNSTIKAMIRSSPDNLDKVRTCDIELFGRKVLSDLTFSDRTNYLSDLTATNKQLAAEVEQKLTELYLYLESVETTKTTTTTIGTKNNDNNTWPSDFARPSNLSDRQRLADVITDTRRISVLLYKSLAKTDGLVGDFGEQERALADQLQTIESLHNQMDSINDDLETKLTSHVDCMSSSRTTPTEAVQ